MNFKNFYLVTVLFFLTEQNVYAYIDPGTGSIILQAIIAAIATGMVFFNNLKQKIKNFFKSKKNEKNEK